LALDRGAIHKVILDQNLAIDDAIELVVNRERMRKENEQTKMIKEASFSESNFQFEHDKNRIADREENSEDSSIVLFSQQFSNRDTFCRM
jgi:hypothetical protein